MAFLGLKEDSPAILELLEVLGSCLFPILAILCLKGKLAEIIIVFDRLENSIGLLGRRVRPVILIAIGLIRWWGLLWHTLESRQLIRYSGHNVGEGKVVLQGYIVGWLVEVDKLSLKVERVLLRWGENVLNPLDPLHHPINPWPFVLPGEVRFAATIEILGLSNVQGFAVPLRLPHIDARLGREIVSEFLKGRVKGGPRSSNGLSHLYLTRPAPLHVRTQLLHIHLLAEDIKDGLDF
mmetsp:Transcript_18626/g.38767  ORF Transcript_18626/g.38767 Transcript_18626/m.38767 type:complete len:237 (+) Transcript_18626:1158-1868(+)